MTALLISLFLLGAALLVRIYFTVQAKQLRQEIEVYKRENARLRKDGLTGALHRKVWEEELARRLEEQGQVVCIVDVNYLKTINDRYGHVCGDKVIACLAASLQLKLKEEDLIGRYGGDELVVAFARDHIIDDGHIKNADAEEQVSRIFARVHKHFVSEIQAYFRNEVGATETLFGFSYGYTCVDRGKCDIDAIYDSADRMLYERKQRRTLND